MPIIRVDGPEVADIDKKRQFVKEVTSAASVLYGLPEKIIVVLLQENSPNNVASGGKLICDLHESD
ncbi:MAG: tautomerase family protein [Candidatus Aegiribacteria sp.]|nr:tautomerase family protein [Candidatus Aegiribacteria sp.]